MAVEIAGAFEAEDYLRGYVCVGPGRKCSPNITILDDGVWFRDAPEGMELSAHRGCVTQ